MINAGIINVGGGAGGGGGAGASSGIYTINSQTGPAISLISSDSTIDISSAGNVIDFSCSGFVNGVQVFLENTINASGDLIISTINSSGNYLQSIINASGDYLQSIINTSGQVLLQTMEASSGIVAVNDQRGPEIDHQSSDGTIDITVSSANVIDHSCSGTVSGVQAALIEIINGKVYGGYIRITDVQPSGGGIVGNKVYQDAGGTILQSCESDENEVTLSIEASYPIVQMTTGLKESGYLTLNAYGVYTGTLNVYAEDGANTVQVFDANDVAGAVDTVAIDVVAGPEVLSLTFIQSYPGSQTELKENDTIQMSGTLDIAADLIEVQNYGACKFQEIAIVEDTSFVITATIDDEGDVVQSLSGQIRARASNGIYGGTAFTDNTVDCNNLYPTITYNTINYPAGQGAFKATESGTVDTTVTDYDTIAYTSGDGADDFTIASPSVYEKIKGIQLKVGASNYNDSLNNYKIVANRAANDATSAYVRNIEVAKVAPTLTITQPQARLRSGGNQGTSAQDYTITMTSDQKLTNDPSGLNVPTGYGTWGGSLSEVSEKQWTRTIEIHDDDSKGTVAWGEMIYYVANKAGLITSQTTGDLVNGGFVERDITFPAFDNEEALGVTVTDTSKLDAEDFDAIDMTYQATTADGTRVYTITSPAGVPNPAGNLLYWADQNAVNNNATGTAFIRIQETV